MICDVSGQKLNVQGLFSAMQCTLFVYPSIIIFYWQNISVDINWRHFFVFCFSDRVVI